MGHPRTGALVATATAGPDRPQEAMLAVATRGKGGEATCGDVSWGRTGGERERTCVQETPLQRARVSGSSAAAAPDRAVLEVPRGIPYPATAVRPAGEVGVGRVPGAARFGDPLRVCS